MSPCHSGKGALLLYALLCATLTISAQQPVDISAEGLCPATFCKEDVTAFKEGRYDEAVQSFRKAVQLEPSNEQAHLYLGATLAYQVVPNLQTPENLNTASYAISELDVVLKIDPKNVKALSQEAAIYRNIQKLEEAKYLEKEVISLNPQNAEAFYFIGVIDWQLAYKNSITVLAKEDLTDNGKGNPELSNAGCDVLEQQNGPLIDDAIVSLTEATRIKPQYDDAMQYLNLIYRRRAEIHCHDRLAARTDVVLAQEWNAKAMKARKENETRKENDALRLPR